MYDKLIMLKIETLIDLALQSPATQHKVAAATYNKRGRLLSTAWNMPSKSHPIQAQYASRVGQPYRINLHAEILALIRAQENVYSIQVVRIGRDSLLPKPSFPCHICMGYILDSDVREIYFHNQNSQLEIYSL